MKSSSWKQVIVYLAVLIAAYLIYSLADGGGSFLNCISTSTDVQQGVQQSSGDQPDTEFSSGVISVDDLPPEGRTTLQLIKDGGPFPYSKDGTVFSNYEGLLPEKPDGYYHEYTVITPGSSDRGARRIVAGEDGEYYYTSDHYRSFKLIQE
jgi:ribonuclease T1